jgi:hypothetical protein
VIKLRLAELRRAFQRGDPREILLAMAMVERESDRARRAFGLFFEVFAQRGTAFAKALAAHDAIAADCYAAVQANLPRVISGPLVAPLTYLEHGYSPATFRRGVTLSRLLGETNPFPLIRIPWDRDRPWQATFLHEVSHNLQSDLRLWEENRQAVLHRFAVARADPLTTTVYGRWHKEIFADLAAVLLGGPAVAWGMAEFLAHPAGKVLTYRPGGAHPTGYLRIVILAELCRRLGFGRQAAALVRVWRALYPPTAGHRIPGPLLGSASKAAAMVVDEIAFQPRRALAEHALVDAIRFGPSHQQVVEGAAQHLLRGRVPPAVPPRFLVSAARLALGQGAAVRPLGSLLTDHLATVAHPGPPGFRRDGLVGTPLAA